MEGMCRIGFGGESCLPKLSQSRQHGLYTAHTPSTTGSVGSLSNDLIKCQSLWSSKPCCRLSQFVTSEHAIAYINPINNVYVCGDHTHSRRRRDYAELRASDQRPTSSITGIWDLGTSSLSLPSHPSGFIPYRRALSMSPRWGPPCSSIPASSFSSAYKGVLIPHMGGNPNREFGSW